MRQQLQLQIQLLCAGIGKLYNFLSMLGYNEILSILHYVPIYVVLSIEGYPCKSFHGINFGLMGACQPAVVFDHAHADCHLVSFCGRFLLWLYWPYSRSCLEIFQIGRIAFHLWALHVPLCILCTHYMGYDQPSFNLLIQTVAMLWSQ